MTLTQNQFTLRVGEAHLNSAHSTNSLCAHSSAHTLLHTHFTHALCLSDKGRGRGFIYIFLMSAKTSSIVAAPITANGNIVGLISHQSLGLGIRLNLLPITQQTSPPPRPLPPPFLPPFHAVCHLLSTPRCFHLTVLFWVKPGMIYLLLKLMLRRMLVL